VIGLSPAFSAPFEAGANATAAAVPATAIIENTFAFIGVSFRVEMD
jgi:hypothetical protein